MPSARDRTPSRQWFSLGRVSAATAAAARCSRRRLSCLEPGSRPLSFVFHPAGGDSRELRYFVLKGKANPALAMLESSVRGTHVLGGPEGRRYKVPPPNVCNSVLARAAEVGCSRWPREQRAHRSLQDDWATCWGRVVAAQ